MDGLPENRTLAAPKRPSGGALASLRPRLSGWRPEYPPPAAAELLAKALAEADADLVPIDTKMLTVALDATLSLWTPPDDWEAKAGFYLEALDDVPPDLVAAALKTLRLSRRWSTFPKPADLRAPIIEDLDARRAERTKIATALAKAQREPPESGPRVPPTEAEIKRVTEIVADLAKAMRAGSATPDERTRE